MRRQFLIPAIGVFASTVALLLAAISGDWNAVLVFVMCLIGIALAMASDRARRRG